MPSVTLEFWTRTWADTYSESDHQEAVFLKPDATIIQKLWRVLSNDQRWVQHDIPVTEYAGRTLVVYFNAYNDGVGGHTGMYLDDVHLWACGGYGFSKPGGAQKDMARDGQGPNRGIRRSHGVRRSRGTGAQSGESWDQTQPWDEAQPSSGARRRGLQRSHGWRREPGRGRTRPGCGGCDTGGHSAGPRDGRSGRATRRGAAGAFSARGRASVECACRPQ